MPSHSLTQPLLHPLFILHHFIHSRFYISSFSFRHPRLRTITYRHSPLSFRILPHPIISQIVPYPHPPLLFLTLGLFLHTIASSSAPLSYRHPTLISHILYLTASPPFVSLHSSSSFALMKVLYVFNIDNLFYYISCNT